MVSLPVLSDGNEKLGRVDILNRAVGDTCSPTCPFLARSDIRKRLTLTTRQVIARGKVSFAIPDCAKCYAEHTEDRFAAARAIGEQNKRVSTAQIFGMLWRAYRRGRAIRLHERGDFGNGKPHAIDARYVGAIERGIDKAIALNVMPAVWAYTHVYHERLAALADRRVSIYASCHNSDDVALARRAGFERFAVVLPKRTPGTCKPQVRGLKEYNGAQRVTISGVDAIVCPAQYLANGTNKPNCDECGLCVHSRANVAFLIH
jgi:hypothetical protein